MEGEEREGVDGEERGDGRGGKKGWMGRREGVDGRREGVDGRREGVGGEEARKRGRRDAG